MFITVLTRAHHFSLSLSLSPPPLSRLDINITDTNWPNFLVTLYQNYNIVIISKFLFSEITTWLPCELVRLENIAVKCRIVKFNIVIYHVERTTSIKNLFFGVVKNNNLATARTFRCDDKWCIITTLPLKFVC